jgi:hypothetical protein
LSKRRFFQFHFASFLALIFVSGLVLAIGSIPPQKDGSRPRKGFSTGWPWTVYRESWVIEVKPDPVTPINSNGFTVLIDANNGPVYRSHWYWESVPFNALIAFTIGFAAALPIEIFLRVRQRNLATQWDSPRPITS